MTLKQTLVHLFDEDELAELFMYGEGELSDNASDIKFSLQDSYGGEGQGDAFWSVYKFESCGETFYIEFVGWYASYHGAEYSRYRFVEPKKKEVTVYV